ncbi:MAG: hypothetical protein ABI068_07910 [Ktedonobacterales bacterium]
MTSNGSRPDDVSGDGGEASSAPHTPSSPDLAPPDPSPDTLTTVDLDLLLARRHPAQRRMARAALPVVALVALVTVLTALFGGPLASLTHISHIFGSSAGNTQTLAITANVATASVTFNGARLAGTFPLVASLHEGENELALRAAPFDLLTCMLTWYPPELLSPTPGCDDISHTSTHVAGARIQPTLLLNLYLSDPSLPYALNQGALAVVSQALAQINAPVRVPAGDYIATGLTTSGHGQISITSMRAAAPLTATIAFALATGLDALGVQPLCVIGTLCGASPQAQAGDALALSPMRGVAQVWLVSAQTGVRWHFTDATGRQVAQSPLIALTIAALIELAYTPGASAPWRLLSMQVGPPSGAATTPETQALQAQLGPAACNSGFTALTTSLPKGSFTPVGLVATVGLNGCVIQAQEGTSAADTANSIYLWRFGVLLAVDANAHQLAPDLPLAPADEVAAVKSAANG